MEMLFAHVVNDVGRVLSGYLPQAKPDQGHLVAGSQSDGGSSHGGK